MYKILFFTILYSLIGNYLFAQNFYHPNRDTIQFRSIMVLKKNQSIGTAFYYFKIKDKYYDANDYPFSYIGCWGLSVLEIKEIDSITIKGNYKRETRFIKRFNKIANLPIDDLSSFEDSNMIYYLQNRYKPEQIFQDYNFSFKTINLYTTYYIIKCEDDNSTDQDKKKMAPYEPLHYILITDYLKWWVN